MRGLHLATTAFDFSIGADDGLRDVDGVVLVFRETQTHRDVVLAGTGADGFHLGGVDSERILDVLDIQVKVD